jgi:hypothetical protein
MFITNEILIKVPTLAQHSSLLEFPFIPECILCLNEGEIRLVSPRIAFLRIKPLKWDQQQGLNGNVVNVPVDVNKTIVEFLPRTYEETQIIQLDLMRRMEYKYPYVTEKIRIDCVRKALGYLKLSDLYEKLSIKIDENKLNKSPTSDGKTDDFIVNPVEYETARAIAAAAAKTKVNTVSGGHGLQTNATDKCDGDPELELYNDDPNYYNQQIRETMLIQDDARITAEKDQIVIKIAPGQRNSPVAAHKDEFAVDGTFIQIFGGTLNYKQTPNNISVQARCKSYFRNVDMRCRANIQFLFYMYRLLLATKLNAQINFTVRQESVPLTVIDALDKEKLHKKIDPKNLTEFLKNLPNTPAYWLECKRNIFAMIRQLGPPTFFKTFSPVEVDWPELITALFKVRELSKQNDKILTQKQTCPDDSASQHQQQKPSLAPNPSDVSKLSRSEILDLIRNDPVTTTRYFEDRMRQFAKYMFNPQTVYQDNPVIDFYWRVEFQARGSPHVHMIVWLRNAPVPYILGMEKSSESYKNIVNFIDKYITCYSPASDQIVNSDNIQEDLKRQQLEKLINYQRHIHRNNCLVDVNKKINAYNYSENRNEYTNLVGVEEDEKASKRVCVDNKV